MNCNSSCQAHGYVGSLYFQTRSDVFFFANLASGFHALFFAGRDWCSGDSCLDEQMTCTKSCAVEQVLGGRHVALAFQFFHNSFVSGDNGQMVCLYERQTVL